jgi:hypothetical protein
MTSTVGDASTAVSTNGQAAVLQFQGINKTFLAKGTPVRALLDVNLTIGTNEFTTLIGPTKMSASSARRTTCSPG